MDNHNQIVVAGQNLLSNWVAAGAVNPRGTWVGKQAFVAGKAKLPEADYKGKTMAEMVKAIVAKGLATADDCKNWARDYATMRADYFVANPPKVAALAAMPGVRVTLKPAFNAKGQVIGANATFRREPSKAQSNATKVAALEKELAGVRALLKANNISLPAIA